MDESDKKLLLKIGRGYDDVIRRLTALENHMNPPTKAAAARSKDDVKLAHGTSAIELIFKDDTGDKVKQKVLVESLYATMKKLCEDNNIFQMNIKIDN